MHKRTLEDLANSCIVHENNSSVHIIDHGKPVLARLEIQGYPSFIKSFKQPFDESFSHVMHEVTRSLISQFDCLLGYTQTNEITLMWNALKSNIPLENRENFQKRSSMIASAASTKMARLMALIPGKEDKLPVLDCRVWNVPTPEDALEVLLWREKIAISLSVTIAASSRFSNMQIIDKTLVERRQMLLEKGINWNDYPTWAQRGQFFRKVINFRDLTAEELAKMPPNNRPTCKIQRNSIDAWDLPLLSTIKNLPAVIFHGAGPILKSITLKTGSNLVAID